jgi:hypothetical protein
VLSMEAYAKAVKRRERLSWSHLEQFETALDWARMGTIGSQAHSEGPRPAEAVKDGSGLAKP